MNKVSEHTPSELKKALKACVEATGDDLDGNNNDYGWLIRNGASVVKDVVDEIEPLEEQVEALQAEVTQLKELVFPLLQYTSEYYRKNVDRTGVRHDGIESLLLQAKTITEGE